MTNDPAWEQLLTSLGTWADARKVAGGVEVSFVGRAGARRTVEIIMTPEDWEEMAEVIGVDNEDSLKRRLLTLEEDERFLVCDSGVELIASPGREPPPDDDFEPEPGGQWVAADEAGNVVSRPADWNGEEN